MATAAHIREPSKQHPAVERYAIDGRAPATVLRLPAVVARTSLSRATIYRMIKRSQFPKPHQLTARCVGWLEIDIEQWISSAIAGGANDL